MSTRTPSGMKGNDTQSFVSGSDMSTFSTVGDTKIDEQTYNADPRYSSTFEIPDTEEYITWTTEAGSDFKIIQMASVEKLIQTIMSKEFNDQYFLECFVLAYKLVTTPERILELIGILFDPACPEGMSWDDFAKSFISPLRLKIMNFVRTWMRNAHKDFEGKEDLIDKLQQLIDRFVQFNPTMGKNLQKMFQNLIAHAVSTQNKFSDEVTERIIMVERSNPKYVNVLQYHPHEFAKQITLLQSELFRKVPYNEFLGNAWTKKNKEELAPNILNLVRSSQVLFNYVQTMIVTENRVVYRGLIIHYFLQVADKLRKLGNFEGMKAVFSGLQSTAIYRLKDSWDCITEEDKKIEQQLNELCDNARNFAKLREVMKIAIAPCIPYIGSTMGDLVFTEDGNKTGGKNDLVNWFKIRQIGNLIKEIMIKQAVGYPFERYEALLVYYENAPKLDNEDQLYELSLNLEKKRGEMNSELQKRIKKNEKEGHDRIKKYNKFIANK